MFFRVFLNFFNVLQFSEFGKIYYSQFKLDFISCISIKKKNQKLLGKQELVKGFERQLWKHLSYILP